MTTRSLCQRGSASCGACCGLYNRADFSREGVRALLARRTRALAGVPRTKEAFAAAARALAAEEEPPLFPSVRVCPLLGFLDDAETRVGCLAHPSYRGVGADDASGGRDRSDRGWSAAGGLGGVGGPVRRSAEPTPTPRCEDLRDCGVYDASICESFLCPSHSWLSEDEAELAARATGDFHLYGLVVTDVPFLRACLAGVAAEAGIAPALSHLDDPRFRAAFRRLLALKEELAAGSDGLYGAFRPGGDGEPVPRSIDYAALGREQRPGAALDAILTCAGADPRSGNDLDALEVTVRERLRAAGRALAAPASSGPDPGATRGT